MTDRFHLNKFLQPASFNILQFYCLPCIFPPWTHTSKHTLKNSVCTHNLSYHQIINLFTCCWTQIWTVIWNLKIWVSRVLCGTFLGLMVIWGITYLLDAHSTRQSAGNLFDVGAQLAIMRRHQLRPRVITCEEKRGEEKLNIKPC